MKMSSRRGDRGDDVGSDAGSVSGRRRRDGAKHREHGQVPRGCGARVRAGSWRLSEIAARRAASVRCGLLRGGRVVLGAEVGRCAVRAGAGYVWRTGRRRTGRPRTAAQGDRPGECLLLLTLIENDQCCSLKVTTLAPCSG